MAADRRTWIVQAGRGSELIDFLSGAGDLSRRAAKRILDERRVFVNGHRTWMTRHALRPGDRVEVYGAWGGGGARRPAAAAERDPDWARRVLWEDADYLVLDKPAGVTSNGPASAEERLRAARAEPALAAAHRIDRDTTGCLVFARSPRAFDALVERFRRREVKKEYEAIAIGRYPAGLREIAEPVEGRPARTLVRVVRAGEAASRLRLEIESGRTHQIRRHLLSVRHPLAGDKEYGTGPALPPALRAVPRQMLHAARVAFDHPLGGARVDVEAPLPADFARALKDLGLG